jgi:hypothetical protein
MPVDPPASRSDLAASPQTPVAPWPWWQLALFRIAAVYFVLYALVPDSRWPRVTSWMHARGLAPYDVIHQPTGSGDTGHDFAKLLAMLALTPVLAAAWSLLHRRLGNGSAHPRLARWLHALVRWYLAVVLLGYGLHKFYGGQFGDLGPHRLLTRVGDLAPMTMVGTFMKASKAYELFGGGGEVLAGLLLFHRRTALLGALVATGVMTNVAALNWCCGVPVKLFSAHLLVFAMALLVPFVPGLWSMTTGGPPAPPVDLQLAQRRRPHLVLTILGWLGAVWWLVTSHFEGMAPRPWMAAYGKGPHHGAWQVERMLVDGTELAADDCHRWRWLAFERGTMAFVDEQGGVRHLLEAKPDPKAADDDGLGATLVVTRGTGTDKSEEGSWRLQDGTKTVPMTRPMARTWQERAEPIPAERRTLTVRGTFAGRPIEVHAVEMVFPLQKGFLLRQELPEGW